MILRVSKPYLTIDSLLFDVDWDSGENSTEYGSKMLCLGRFSSPSALADAIHVVGPAQVTLGPQGGFRQATIEIEFDGRTLATTIYDGALWLRVVRQRVTDAGLEPTEIRVPRKQRAR